MGGRRAVDIYENWDGPFQAKQLTQGVSGSKYYSFDDINDAWARLQQSFPFLIDRESIRQWHKTIPHTETNLSPTYSRFDGPHVHRKLAEAYTFTEMDDEEMIYFRKKRTKQITGTWNGEITDRAAHYKREGFITFGPEKLFQWGQNNYPPTNDDNSIHNKPPTNSPTHSNNNNDDDDEYMDAIDEPNSQDFHSRTDNTPQKRRKVDTSPDNNTDTNNQTTNKSNTIVTLPIPITATLHDSIMYLNGFKPGFGALFDGQTRLCKHFWYKDWICVSVQCTDSTECSQLLNWTTDKPFFGKYRITSISDEGEDLSDYNIIPSEKLESFASHPLIQYIKNTLPHQHSSSFNEVVLKSDTPEQVFEHYSLNWKENPTNTVSNDNVPQLITIPDYNLSDEDNDGTAISF